MVIVVGGGPAGLMAADVASASGARVTVFDAKRSAGRKLLVAGKGGLNLTHSEPLDVFLTRYRGAPELERHVRAFPPAALRAFAEALGQATYVGSSGRVFPREAKAAPLLRAWIASLRKRGVAFRTRHAWRGFDGDGLVFRDLATQTDVRERADACVLALGGGSWPSTGSDGAWVAALRDAGIDVSDLSASNAGFQIAWPPAFLAKAEGKAIKNVALSFGGETARGDVVVTKTGLEGTPVYRLNPVVRAALPATIAVDLKPDVADLGPRMARGLRSLKLDAAARALLSTLPRVEGDALALRVKAFPLQVTALRPIAEAISSAGGVRFSEVNDDLMLRKRPGTFVAGEMLDWEAPTGGYLLQACFATGRAAGLAAAAYASEHASSRTNKPG